MSWADAGILGDIITSLATIITLAYLAVQIRQNTHTMRLSSTASHVESLSSTTLLLAQDPQINTVYFEGLASEGPLDEQRERQFSMVLAHFMMAIQQVYLLESEKSLHPEITAYLETTIGWLVQQPGFRRYWDAWGPTNPPNFRTFIDAYIRAN